MHAKNLGLLLGGLGLAVIPALSEVSPICSGSGITTVFVSEQTTTITLPVTTVYVTVPSASVYTIPVSTVYITLPPETVEVTVIESTVAQTATAGSSITTYATEDQPGSGPAVTTPGPAETIIYETETVYPVESATTSISDVMSTITVTSTGQQTIFTTVIATSFDPGATITTLLSSPTSFTSCETLSSFSGMSSGGWNGSWSMTTVTMSGSVTLINSGDPGSSSQSCSKSFTTIPRGTAPLSAYCTNSTTFETNSAPTVTSTTTSFGSGGNLTITVTPNTTYFTSVGFNFSTVSSSTASGTAISTGSGQSIGFNTSSTGLVSSTVLGTGSFTNSGVQSTTSAGFNLSATSLPSTPTLTSMSNLTVPTSIFEFSSITTSILGNSTSLSLSSSASSGNLTVSSQSPAPTILTTSATSTFINSTSTSTSSSSATTTSTCGEIGDFVLNFDDIPPLSVGNENGTINPEPVFDPYHQFDFSNGFKVVPPPTDKYQPSSPPTLLRFEPQDNANFSSPFSSPNTQNLNYSGAIFDGDDGRTGCFAFNAYGASLGCDSLGSDCVFTISGYHLDLFVGANVLVAYQRLNVPACPTSINCQLVPVQLDSSFADLTEIRINVTVDSVPKMWWMDDLSLGWFDNSCSTGTCRTTTRLS